MTTGLRRIRGVCAAAIGLVLLLPGVAFAQYPGGDPHHSPSPQVGGEKFFRGNEGELSTTGVDILMILAIALVVLALGLVVRRFSRATPREP